MESLCQRSFRPLFKYRTIVLYLFSPHPCRAQLFIDLLFFFIYISGLFLSLFTSSTLHLLFFLHFIYTSFSIHFRDHPATILNVTVGFLSLLYLFLFYSACSFFVSKGNNPPFHLVSFLLSLCLFHPKPLSKMTQPSVSFALFRAHFILYYYLSVFIFHAHTYNYMQQKTATPIDSGITVCVEIYFYKPICQRRNPRICLSFYRDKDCPCAK